MRVKILPISNKRGFTLVELALTIGILAVLSTIAIGEFYDRRRTAYDRQAIAITKHLLTMAATAFANSNYPTVDGTVTVGTNPQDYADLPVNPGIHCYINRDAAKDLYRFYIANVAGETAYFFWLPGETCVDTVDGGSPSDLINENSAWRLAIFGL